MILKNYEIAPEQTDKEKLAWHVTHHKRHMSESIKTLEDDLNTLVEYAYSGNIVETIRAVHTFKSEAEHLINTADHLLLMIEGLSEPDHGGI